VSVGTDVIVNLIFEYVPAFNKVFDFNSFSTLSGGSIGFDPGFSLASQFKVQGLPGGLSIVSTADGQRRCLPPLRRFLNRPLSQFCWPRPGADLPRRAAAARPGRRPQRSTGLLRDEDLLAALQRVGQHVGPFGSEFFQRKTGSPDTVPHISAVIANMIGLPVMALPVLR
jgi:hypothetical protein